MEVLQLTPKGIALSHSVNNPDTPGWRVIHYMAKHRYQATKDQILQYVPNADSGTIALLKVKGIVTS